MNKKRLYTLDQESLDVIKTELKERKMKSNNQQAVEKAVCWYAEQLKKYIKL
tara:strand:+ start:458 stop:613 length:156 start_codon:yes stop_codon:yes gene_type:complete